MRRAFLDDAVEVAKRRRVVLHVEQRLAHEELGALLVGFVVARLAFDDLVELDRRVGVVLGVVELERPLEHLRRRTGRARRLGRLGRELHLVAFFAVVTGGRGILVDLLRLEGHATSTAGVGGRWWRRFGATLLFSFGFGV